MKTLGQHNETVAEVMRMLRTEKAGVACDKCGTEMESQNKTSHDRGMHVRCPACGLTGYKEEVQ